MAQEVRPPANEATKSESANAFFKECFLWLVGAPAVLGVLGNLPKQIKLDDLLNRIVLSFRTVSEHFWEQVAGFLSFPFPVNHLFFSFLTLLTLPAIVHLIRCIGRKSKPLSSAGALWMLTSFAAVLFFVYFFQPSPVVQVMLMIAAGISLPVRAFLHSIRSNRNVLVKYGVPIAVAALSSTCFQQVYLAFSTGWDGVGDPVAWTYSALYCLLYFPVSYAVAEGFRVPAKILLLSLGVLATNWMVTIGVPAVSAWLTAVGA